MMIFVYKIYFPVSNKCYVGQTVNVAKRMWEHLNAGYLAHKALHKYANWEISILHVCGSRDEANKLEAAEIDQNNSIAPSGYNLTKGGDGVNGQAVIESNRRRKGQRQTPELIEKRRNSLTGKKRPYMVERNKGNKYWLGRRHSEEAKEKIRQANIGKPCSDEKREKIRQSSLGKKQPKSAILKCQITKLRKKIKAEEQKQ